MLELISALFPNLCIMVTLLFVSTTLLPQDAARLTFGRKVLITLCMAMIPLLLYRYSVPLGPGRFDLRYVPIALGTLWGGPLAGLVVALPLMGLRLYQMNSGTLSALISIGVLILLATLTRPGLNLRHRNRYLNLRDLPRVTQVFSLNAIGTVFAVNGVATFSQIYLPLLIMNVAGLYVASAVVQHRLGILSTFRTALAQSRLDALTGLANRRQFDEDLAELQPGETLLMLDIDHFKAINDFHGHAAGDAVLREMGRFLGSALRGSDSAYRFGGEEFAVILRGDSPPSVTQISERLRRQVAALPPAAPSLRPITVSIGAAVHTGHPPQDTLRHADQALYRAKNGGRNRSVLWEPPPPAPPAETA